MADDAARNRTAEGADYDVLIVGAGQVATPLALSLAKKGLQVAVAERHRLGGSCVNFGCTPTKAAIVSATVAQLARRGEEFGLRIAPPESDFAAVLRRAESLADYGRQVLTRTFAKARNPALLWGRARIAGRAGSGFRVAVGEASVTARQVVIDSGTASLMPAIEGLAEADPLTAETWLERPSLPRRLAMIGGGTIGLEMAQFYRRMGSEVTVVEGGERIAAQEDALVSDRLRSLLEREGLSFRCGAEVERIERLAGGHRLQLADGSALEADAIFLAIGRKPNTDDLGLEALGVERDDKGFLTVDERLATSCPGIWAAGDVRGGLMVTHSAVDDARILASQLAGDGERTTAGRIVPYALFTDPPLGRVGLTERAAREAGHEVRTGCYEMSSSGMARERAATGGLIHLVVERGSERILGAAILAPEAGELIHLYAMAMEHAIAWPAFQRQIHVHPTLAEALQSAFDELD